ncbi:hypothetical protein ADK47_04045 [Streptomyces rimosus subsp. rimosus]|uniref:Lipoprotein n=1 Tax=Streptomyces rimosus subsp. rimosus TaxID=132474 RepID=A0ABY3ZCJ8_STRRM|nr:hypothetical protein DF17_04050 [Streptomyces rimosus]KOG80021.1 hypothetical protein ADK78_05005 [Kitasatospora aureofaciens]KOT31030.1 hypothetical protein ADK42_29215 [Streptomyces rimosus subsp. rimosus]KOT31080.1 hypothetical protein ADK84_30590 [Streptomyces sp. NRRL WC-3701]KOT66739.1 hypothetical protein ADK44_05190 [Streptomyces rimosus subsp. rimosus]
MLKIDLDGVEGGQGVTGVQSKTVNFTVGRSQVSTVDMNTQTMTVVRDGRTVKSIPSTGGGPKAPTGQVRSAGGRVRLTAHGRPGRGESDAAHGGMRHRTHRTT